MLQLLLAFALLRSAAPPALPGGGFVEQVRHHFSSWDADGDGVLFPDEIERVVADPKVKGDTAAAAAALRRTVRANRNVGPLSLGQIADGDKADAKPRLPGLEAMYAAHKDIIKSTRRDLFVSDPPKLEGIHQRRLGDCFLLASLGSVVANDPGRLMKAFKQLPGDKVEVTFATKKLVLDMPTDGEVCIGARNGNDGMWALVYEKAVGTVLLGRQKSERHATPQSIIGVGGTPNVPLELLTGHAVRRTGCEDFQSGKLDEAQRERRLAEVRQNLAAALREGRLIVGGTAPLGGKATVVPGLYYNHSYGVLGYDERTDVVTFWNPFGNRYKPKGEPGLKNGFVTENGRFSMKLPDAVMWFGSFSIETGEPSTRFPPENRD